MDIITYVHVIVSIHIDKEHPGILVCNQQT